MTTENTTTTTKPASGTKPATKTKIQAITPPSEFWNLSKSLQGFERLPEGTANRDAIFKVNGISYVFDALTNSVIDLDTRQAKAKTLLNKKGNILYQETARLIAGVRGTTTGKAGKKIIEM